MEEKELKSRRKKQVHKAQPVRRFKSVQVKPSEKPLTEPKTPRFVRRQRTTRE
jgi:targeting protein for Xklp2